MESFALYQGEKNPCLLTPNDSHSISYIGYLSHMFVYIINHHNNSMTGIILILQKKQAYKYMIKSKLFTVHSSQEPNLFFQIHLQLLPSRNGLALEHSLPLGLCSCCSLYLLPTKILFIFESLTKQYSTVRRLGGSVY